MRGRSPAGRAAFAAALLLLLALPALAQNPSVDVLHYRVELTLSAAAESIVATTELTIRPVAASLESLQLDFAGLTVDGVTVEGEEARFERTADRLTIATHRQTAEPFHVAVRYHGKPKDGLLLQANKHGDPSAFADNWPNRARFWIPSVDHPSDKATVEFIVTAPAAYDVIANGTLLGTTTLAGGAKRTHWSESTPIPVHCMVIGATEFAIVPAGATGGTEIAYWLYPRDRADGPQLGRVKDIVAFYTATVGPYPYEKLALVESSTKFGGMENAGAIFLDEKRINGGPSVEALAAHEIAHQWFGDSVTQRQWHDVEQKQSGQVFRVPTVIEVRNEAGAHRENVLIDQRIERFELPSEQRPTDVVLDPDEWVLKEMTQ
jgi:aminopeptidase N